eukprot:bmy_20066T0
MNTSITHSIYWVNKFTKTPTTFIYTHHTTLNAFRSSNPSMSRNCNAWFSPQNKASLAYFLSQGPQCLLSLHRPRKHLPRPILYQLFKKDFNADADHPRHLPSKPTRGTTPQHLSPISLRGTHHLSLPQPHRRKPNTYAPSPFYDNCVACLLHTSTSLRIVQNTFYNFRWGIWINFLHGYRIPWPTWNDWFYIPNHGVYGSTLFMATGFHGRHGMIGSTFLIPANPTRPRIPNPKKKKKLYITILVILQIFLIITLPAVERILVYILFEATLVPTLTPSPLMTQSPGRSPQCRTHSPCSRTTNTWRLQRHNNSKSTHRFQSISLSHPFLTRNNSHSLHFFTPNRLTVTHHIFISQLHSTIENNKFLQTTALRLGAITTPFTATGVLTQNDIQKMVVFSTFSQVGLIIVTMA